MPCPPDILYGSCELSGTATRIHEALNELLSLLLTPTTRRHACKHSKTESTGRIPITSCDAVIERLYARITVYVYVYMYLYSHVILAAAWQRVVHWLAYQ